MFISHSAHNTTSSSSYLTSMRRVLPAFATSIVLCSVVLTAAPALADGSSSVSRCGKGTIVNPERPSVCIVNPAVLRRARAAGFEDGVASVDITSDNEAVFNAGFEDGVASVDISSDNEESDEAVDVTPECVARILRRDLSDFDLSGLDLSGLDLSGADLYDVNLRNANLSGTDLSNANLAHANLSGVNLSDAELSGANLSDANLYNGDLSGANLYDANLQRAELTDVDFTDANMSDADLRYTDLGNNSWTGSTCPDRSKANDNGGTCEGHL